MSSEARKACAAPCPCAVTVEVRRRWPSLERHTPRGAHVYLEGEAASRVWYLRRGCVVLVRAASDDGREAPHAVRRAGSLLGLEALVRDTYLDSARVTADALLCSVSREAMDEWLQEPMALRAVLAHVLTTGSADVPRACRSEGTAVERVARWLLAEASQGAPTRVTRRVAAGLLGMVPETLSRALARLAEAGAIEVGRSHVVVRDLPRLRELAGG
jgi:CRP-like cAMP-binding protein